MESIEIQDIERKKRFLKRYKKNRALVLRLKNKLDILDERLQSVKSPSLSGMPRGGQPVTVADLLADKLELEERISRLEEKGTIIRREILEEIDNLEDERYAEILEAYFIDNKDFDEIAEDIGYHEKSVIRLYSTAIKELTVT